MNTIKLSSSRTIIAALFASTIWCYGTGVDARADPVPTAVGSPYADLLARQRLVDRDVVRVRADAGRHRLWVLTVSHVYVYDTRKLTLVRTIKLPNWSFADYDQMCPPDIVLDTRGDAFVSNNVQPRMLQIGARGFETQEHELKLVSTKNLDVGFGSLAFAPDGSLLGVSAHAGMVFRIDLARRSATEVVSSQRMSGACGFGGARMRDH